MRFYHRHPGNGNEPLKPGTTIGFTKNGESIKYLRSERGPGGWINIVSLTRGQEINELDISPCAVLDRLPKHLRQKYPDGKKLVMRALRLKK